MLSPSTSFGCCRIIVIIANVCIVFIYCYILCHVPIITYYINTVDILVHIILKTPP